jgi:serine protease Do
MSSNRPSDPVATVPVSTVRPARSVLGRAALYAGAAAAATALTLSVLPVAPQITQPALARAFSAGPASFADVVDQVTPAVVSVRVRAQGPESAQPNELPPGMERFFRDRGVPGPRGNGRPTQMSQGSGFFISADGFVVTNHHVVANAVEVQLITHDGRTLNARVVGSDPRTDLALLKVSEGRDFPFVRFASGTPRIGDWVLAVGNPFGLGGTVTAGILSARGRDIGAGPYDDFLQIDAAVNRGNSGGPSFNAAGEVVGVNTAIVSPSGGNVGIAFAIPSATVEKVIADLRAKGSVSRGFIGVQIQPVTAEVADAIGLNEARGALIAETTPEGPAARAGLRRGDTVLAVNGQPIRDARQLSRVIAEVKPGERVTLNVWRDGRERQVSFEVARQPSA